MFDPSWLMRDTIDLKEVEADFYLDDKGEEISKEDFISRLKSNIMGVGYLYQVIEYPEKLTTHLQVAVYMPVSSLEGGAMYNFWNWIETNGLKDLFKNSSPLEVSKYGIEYGNKVSVVDIIDTDRFQKVKTKKNKKK